MRVFVTGGAGFIGSHVADSLLTHGHEVAVVDNLSRGRPENVPADVAFYDLDVRTGCGGSSRSWGPRRCATRPRR